SLADTGPSASTATRSSAEYDAIQYSAPPSRAHSISLTPASSAASGGTESSALGRPPVYRSIASAAEVAFAKTPHGPSDNRPLNMKVARNTRLPSPRRWCHFITPRYGVTPLRWRLFNRSRHQPPSAPLALETRPTSDQAITRFAQSSAWRRSCHG